ncbi:rhamnan synthesis F family protein [Bifidobacterium leontopitheci]|uniref:Rhamnan synthesis F family protein n=1 Tax=Bifidobacterium leontopitheci TaxID=2650774 RepID=A0A6I1GFB6_9BIFI|nr:rhamnan synthesis F family protein [Bifidobacterium leontopitheci]KAB7790330.1 rhamnan synthesis F family protein [Bifidobacterium leontopitheci]
MENNEPMRRLGIYCFYDRNGHAASFIDTFLKGLTPYLADLVVVVNGKLDQESRELFERYTNHIIVRDNTGLDAAAYREAMLHIGWKTLESYDEVICLNDTILGPVYPFSEMFAVMDAKPVDFWGITAYPEETVNNEHIPTHLQAYWHAYRRSLVSSQQFQQYWQDLPSFKSYAAVTRKHEMTFTPHFANLGFTWASYIDYEKYRTRSTYPLLYMPTDLVRDDRCPVFKRRSFFLEYQYYFDQTAGQPGLDLYEYLRDHTDYDVNLIWDALLQSYNLLDIHQAMHLSYVLPKATENPLREDAQHVKAAFIHHIYFLDLLDTTLRYIANIPDSVDLYITTTQDKIEPIREAMQKAGLLENRQVAFIPVQNRGRDVSALLVGARDVVLNGKYDVIGFAHDKKSSQNQDNGHHGTETEGFSYKLFENTMGSRDYVTNILALFANNPRLGMACPPPPYHALYFAHTLPSDWGPNFTITKDLLEKRLRIHVPLDSTKPSMSAMGSCYWFRTEALRPLFEYHWRYESFLPEGQMGPDGTISHAIERSLGYIAQSQGYYPAWVLSDHYARIEVDSLFYTTNTLLTSLGNTRRGETLLANAGQLRYVLTTLGMIRHLAHKPLRLIAKVFVRPLPEPARNVIYRVGWAPLSFAYKVRYWVRRKRLK